jgi:hypothetical protein
MSLTLWLSALQAAGTVVVAANLVFFVRQLKLMSRQIASFDEDAKARQRQFEHQAELMAQQVRAQNIFEVNKYLEKPEHLRARKRITLLAQSRKPYLAWSDDDREAADDVARVWTVIANWQRMGVLPEQYIQIAHGNTILRHWRAVEPYVDQLRKDTGLASRRTFEEMAEEIEALGWYKHGGDARPDPLMPAALPNNRRPTMIQ